MSFLRLAFFWIWVYDWIWLPKARSWTGVLLSLALAAVAKRGAPTPVNDLCLLWGTNVFLTLATVLVLSVPDTFWREMAWIPAVRLNYWIISCFIVSPRISSLTGLDLWFRIGVCLKMPELFLFKGVGVIYYCWFFEFESWPLPLWCTKEEVGVFLADLRLLAAELWGLSGPQIEPEASFFLLFFFEDLGVKLCIFALLGDVRNWLSSIGPKSELGVTNLLVSIFLNG